MFLLRYKVEEGSPYPLGATPDKKGVNFALFSKNAEKVALCLFNTWGYETHHIPMIGKTGDVWHVYVQGLKPGQRYGYRVFGPFDPENGQRFNPHKLLLDPAAKMVTHTLSFHKNQLAYEPGSEERDLSYSKSDSADYMPKCIVTDLMPLKKRAEKPNIPWSETVLYETHVKGFTMHHPDVKVDFRGKFLGMTTKKVISYIKSLGITSVEFLPITASYTPGFLKHQGLSNYWGYDPICFMAPQPTYFFQRQLKELQDTVNVMHEAGVEVILDVVYNHSGEGNEMGPTFCFRGIDNASYYRLMNDNPRYYNNDTGCGNSINLSNPGVVDLVMQSMRYWHDVFDVDGFRFDLATTLGRGEDGSFSPNAPFFQGIDKDPVLSKLKLIAEPWDLGWGGYQVGNFPSNFAEWNDKFRDTDRRFWKGDLGQAYDMHTEFIGSAVGGNQGCVPNWKRVNFITAHDGFTLNDVVSYNQKHNDANGEENRDGNNTNWSWNSGTEGQTHNEGILDFRLRRAKAMMATLLLANGIPMVLAGDEFLRTQFGNNNAYSQDNKISWLNWMNISRHGQEMQAFVKSVLKLRRDYPFFKEITFPLPDESHLPLAQRKLLMLRPDLVAMAPEDWGETVKTFAVRIKEEENYFFVILNAADQAITYKLPHIAGNRRKWTPLLDSGGDAMMNEKQISVGSWSVVVLVR